MTEIFLDSILSQPNNNYQEFVYNDETSIGINTNNNNNNYYDVVLNDFNFSISSLDYININNIILDQNNIYRFLNATNKSVNSSLISTIASNGDGGTLLKYSLSITVLLGILSGLMSLTTILGNILVITAFVIDKNLRSYSNYFILNLSIADLLIGLLIPPYAPFLLSDYRWHIGRTTCIMWLVLDYVVGSASVLCIVVISLDRFLLVSKGLGYVSQQKISKAICWMSTVWIIAFLNYAPAIIFWEIFSGKEKPDHTCEVGFSNNLIYLTATACVEFFVPLLTISGLNIAVYLNIKKRSKGLIRTANPQFITNNNNNNDVAINNNNNNKNNNSILKAKTVNNDLKCVPPSNPVLNDTKTKANITCKHSNNENQLRCNKSGTSFSSASTSSDTSEMCHFNTNELVNGVHTSNSENETSRDRSSSTNQTTTIVKFKPDIRQLNLNLVNNGAARIINTRNSEGNGDNYKKHVKQIITPKSPSNTSKHSSNNLKKDKKAARSLFILVFVFVSCWAPYTLLTLIRSVCKHCVNDDLYEFSFWLLWFNSTVNPILYPFLHVKFRKAFAKIICCCLKSKNFMNNSKSTFKSTQQNNNNNSERNKLITQQQQQQQQQRKIKSKSFDVRV